MATEGEGAATPPASSAASEGTGSAEAAKPPSNGASAQATPALDKLEQRAADLARELLGPAAEDARAKVKENPLVSVLVALALGFVLGLLFGNTGRGRR